jgi:hypothetical protein
MALADYAQLQDAIKGWLWDREDLAGRVPEFIAMAEADFSDELRVAQMEVSATITLTNGIGPLPNDYVAWRRVLTQDNPVRVLEWADPAWAEDHYYAIAPQPSSHFTVTGSTIKTYPTSVLQLDAVLSADSAASASNPATGSDPQATGLSLRLAHAATPGRRRWSGCAAMRRSRSTRCGSRTGVSARQGRAAMPSTP